MRAAGRAAHCCSPLACAVLLFGLGSSGDARAEAPTGGDAWWGQDKALHFSLSLGIAAAGYGLSVWALDDRFAATGLSAGATIALGAAKEGLDAAGLGEPSWKDFAWDVVGTALGVGISLTFDAALRGP